jgi:hypothetical protein
VHGAPTPEELAVVTALVTAANTVTPKPSTAASTAARRGGWADPASLVRRSLLSGPGAWRAGLR